MVEANMDSVVAILFSGVGAVSNNTANLQTQVKSMCFYADLANYLCEKHQVHMNQVWDRVSNLADDESAKLSALDQILIQFAVQLTSAHIVQETVPKSTQIVSVGHSIGDIAAAVFTEKLTLHEAIDVAVSLATVVETVDGELVFGKLSKDDCIASINHTDQDGVTKLGCAAVLDTLDDDRQVVHTGYPWHHPSYETCDAISSFDELELDPSDSSNLLVSSLLEAIITPQTPMDGEYWMKWCHSGVDLESSLNVLDDSFSVDEIFEASAHPMLGTSVEKVLGEKTQHSSLFERGKDGVNFSVRNKLSERYHHQGLLESINEAAGRKLDPNKTWFESGIDSASIVLLSQKLRSRGTFPLIEAKDFFRYVTPLQLAKEFGNDTSNTTTTMNRDQKQSNTKHPVVISAMSCLLPGNLNTPQQLFAFTSAQGDAVHCKPEFDGGKQPAGYLGEISIEYSKFGLSKSEVATMDPQQALVLNCVDKLLEENDVFQLPASTGVYIGAWNNEYKGDQTSVFYPTGTNQSLIAARISHIYRLHGPCKVINSACASSLEAILEAFKDIAQGKIECAIAGGVNLLWDPEFTKCMSQSGFLGAGGRCRTFDKSADGYVRAEGCGLVLLTRKDLCANGKFYAEILGGASNHNGGRSASITAPSPVAQEDVIRAALLDAQVNATQVDYVECHGTGTKLGDPIEFGAIANQIGSKLTDSQSCYLGSVKSNIGHLEAAAGVVGVIHASMVLAEKRVPLMANFREANPELDSSSNLKFAKSPNLQVDNLSIAGVSSFGFGGSNVHLILQGAPVENLPTPQTPVANISRDELFVFDRQLRGCLAQTTTVSQPPKVINEPTTRELQSNEIPNNSIVMDTFWSIVKDVAGEVEKDKDILFGGLDSLGLTELFLRLEQKLGVEAATLGEYLGGGKKWSDLENHIQSVTSSMPVQQVPTHATAAPTRKASQTPSAPTCEEADSSNKFYTWPQPRFQGIRTTHVGSLPRARDAEKQHKGLYDLIQKQLDMGITFINDGETGRADYASAVLTRMTGFETQEVIEAPHPQDLEDLPCVARRFFTKAGLITLNKSVKTYNPHCVGEIKFTGHNELQSELQSLKSALHVNNAGLEHQVFRTAPSPGTLAVFFECSNSTVYPTYKDYVFGIANALHEEYKLVVDAGLILQVDCPDLAMSRHTKFKHLGLTAWKSHIRTHIDALNHALRGIPRSSVRVHVCWGNYSGTHHRDVSMKEVLPLALNIQAKYFGFESANNRHCADHSVWKDIEIPDDLVLMPGVVDTCSTSVEHEDVVCQRICAFVDIVGPERVIGCSDCGFSTTAESVGLPPEVAWMKLRALVAGARKATLKYYPKVPKFLLRPTQRKFLFCSGPETFQSFSKSESDVEHRVVFTTNRTATDSAALAEHIRCFVDVPVAFETDGTDESEMFANSVKYHLADGKQRNCPAYPDNTKQIVPVESCDMIMNTSSNVIQDTYDVIVVGGGVIGLLAAKQLLDAGVDVALFEKEKFVGGIWTTFANAKSQVNSSEGSYRLLSEYRKRANRDHSTTHEIRTDILKLAQELNSLGRLFTSTPVKNIEETGEKIDNRKEYQVELDGNRSVKCTGVVLAINDRVGKPRPIKWSGSETFRGQIVDGFGGDAETKNIDWVGKQVVIVGMGAFAIENARTALEHGASNVVVLGRRHGTVCPKFIDYVNFVHRDALESGGSVMNTENNSKNMFLWRKLYESSGCTMPECWLDLIKHTGHTISVSDVWFVAHYLGKLETRQGEIGHCTESGVVVKSTGEHIDADIIVRCTGFERNASLVPSITPYKSTSRINYLDDNFMYLADAYIDDDAFNSFFGSSVVEMAKFYIMVFEHFYKLQDVDVLNEEFLNEPIDITKRAWTHYIAGAEFLTEKVPALHTKTNALLKQRYNDFVKTQTPAEYIEANKREWDELHDLLTQGTLEKSCYLPYPQWKC